MIKTLRLAVFLAIGVCEPAVAWAQSVDVGITGVGLLSLQPVDDDYVGGPYLSPAGIGGLGPGFGAGVNAVFGNRLVIASEFTTARFELEQHGRLVPGPRPPGSDGSFIGGSGTTRLRDSLLSGLVGYATPGGGNWRAYFLIGVAARLDQPTVDGENVVPDDPLQSPLPVVVTGGVDVLHAFSPRVSLLLSARYAFVDRFENERYLGIGSSVFRAGGGLRIRLN